jgi:hypothetical protein
MFKVVCTDVDHLEGIYSFICTADAKAKPLKHTFELKSLQTATSEAEE